MQHHRHRHVVGQVRHQRGRRRTELLGGDPQRVGGVHGQLRGQPGAARPTVAGSAAASTGSISTACTCAATASRPRVSEPSPGPTSSATSSGPAPRPDDPAHRVGVVHEVLAELLRRRDAEARGEFPDLRRAEQCVSHEGTAYGPVVVGRDDGAQARPGARTEDPFAVGRDGRAQRVQVGAAGRGQRPHGQRDQVRRVGRPRYGTGVRYGASVSTSICSGGVSAAASRRFAGAAERDRPGEAEVVAAAHALGGELGVTGEAVQHHRVRRALVVEHPQHVVVRLTVVDDQRLAVPLGDGDVRPETRLLGGPPVRRRCGTCPARSRRCRGPGAGRRAPRSRAAPRPDRRAGAPRWGAGRPRPAPHGAGRPASAPQRDEATSTPTWTSRSTPALAAAAISASTGSPPAAAAGSLDAGLLHGDVEVGVAVEDRHGQRLGRGRELAGPAGGRFGRFSDGVAT